MKIRLEAKIPRSYGPPPLPKGPLGDFSALVLRLLMRFLSVALFVAVVIAVPVARGDESTAQGDLRSRATKRFERSLARVQPLLERYGYGASVLAVMVEGMGIPTPGQTLLMASSIEAARGRMNIVLLLFLVTTAATVGNSIGYAIGRWGGRALLLKFRVNPERQQRTEDFFKRRGGMAIFFARFLDGLRQLNGIVAGILKMPWWTFTVYNIAGAIMWTCSWGLGTYFLGRDMHSIAGFLHRHRRFLFVLSIVALASLVVYLLRYRNPRPETQTMQ